MYSKNFGERSPGYVVIDLSIDKGKKGMRAKNTVR